MLTITENQQAHCKIAQFYGPLDKNCIPNDETVYERMLLQINDVNLKGMSDKPKKDYLYVNKFKGCTLLHVACYRGYIKAFDSLLKRGADFTAKNDDGSTALHHAFCSMFLRYPYKWEVINGNLDNDYVNSILMAHIESGNSANPRSCHELSHFHIACAANHLKSVQLFLNSGVCVSESVNVKSTIFPGYTALHFAARFCGYETAKVLLEHGADVEVKDDKGLTPLHVVIERNWQLVELKKDQTLRVDKLNGYITTNEKIIRLFLENNAVMDVGTKEFCKLLGTCTLSDYSLTESFLRCVEVNCAISMNSPVWPGYTPLHFAVHLNIETLKLLLEMGANIEAKDAHGVTPFDLCMKKYSIEDLHNILSVVPALKDIFFSDNQTRLVDFIHSTRSLSAFEVFFQTTPKNAFLLKNCPLWPGYSFLHLLVHFSEVSGFDTENMYRSVNKNAMIQDVRGRTPIHLAFYKKKDNLVDLLFEHQSTITNVVDNDGLSHLHIACERSNEQIVKILLSKGVNVNSVYKGKTLTSEVTSGSTPLHLAVARGNFEIIKMLLHHGANANAIDADGMTPIHCTLTSCPPNVSKKIGDLLFSSCDLKNIIATESRLSHLHVASFTGNEDAVESLLKLGANANLVFSHKITERYSIVSCHLPSRLLRRTPLHFAIMKNYRSIVELLLQYGADILHKTFDGMTLLYEILNECKDLPHEFDDICTKAYFASMLANDKALQKRVEDDTGITSLHIACALHDHDQIQSLLIDSKINVNAQVHSNSPIWSKATPLHVLLYCESYSKAFGDAMKTLLGGGADVTLMDNHENTPTHYYFSYRQEPYHRDHCNVSDLLRSLLTSHKDFSLNPVNQDGISHFHVACMVSEYTIVEKFLEKGVDVNLPIGYRDGKMTFQTPLHLVLQSRLNGQSDTELQLRTIDVLLKYGADVNVQDENCSTALLEAARKGPSRELFFDKLIKARADINYMNLRGESVLEILFNSTEPLTNEEFSFFINNSANLNILNPISKNGIISMIRRANYQKFWETIAEIPSLPVVDKVGRTPIHSIVANDKTKISADKYSDDIERFMKLGYDIDAQDTEGKTALHMAAYFHNEAALLGLLAAGADVNITDANNEPAITRNFQVRYYCQVVDGRIVQVPSPIKKNFALHIITMQLCGFEVHPANSELANSLPRKKSFLSHCKLVSREIEMSKQMTIGIESVTLKDFLSETGVVASRPSMVSEVDREAVDNLLQHVNLKQFPQLRGLITMQYRKTMARLPLMEAATESVRRLLGSVNGFSIPEICSRMIVRFLTNTEVKNLIDSTSTRMAS